MFCLFGPGVFCQVFCSGIKESLITPAEADKVAFTVKSTSLALGEPSQICFASRCRRTQWLLLPSQPQRTSSTLGPFCRKLVPGGRDSIYLSGKLLTAAGWSWFWEGHFIEQDYNMTELGWGWGTLVTIHSAPHFTEERSEAPKGESPAKGYTARHGKGPDESRASYGSHS